MADKYPGINPYAYCAWNPVKLVDPDGREYELIVDHEKKTITIKARYATFDDDAKASATKAIQQWNNLSGKYSFQVKKGNKKINYSINFELSVISGEEYNGNSPADNNYFISSYISDDKNILGITENKHITILSSSKDDITVSSHEIGHTLGLNHNGYEKGLMEEDGGRLSHNHQITKNNINTIIINATHPESRDPKYATGIGTLVQTGAPNANFFSKINTKIIQNKSKK